MTDLQAGLMLPQVYLIAFALLALLVGVRSAPDGWLWHSLTPAAMAIVGLLLAIEAQCVHLFLVLPATRGLTISQFGNALIIDPVGAFGGTLVYVSGLLVVFVSMQHFRDRFKDQGQYYGLLLLLVCISSLLAYASTVAAIGILVVSHAIVQLFLEGIRGTGHVSPVPYRSRIIWLLAASALCAYGVREITAVFGSGALQNIAVRLSVNAYSIGSPGPLGIFLASILFLLVISALMPRIGITWRQSESPASIATTLIGCITLSFLMIRLFAVGFGSAPVWCLLVSVFAAFAMLVGTWHALRNTDVQMIIMSNSFVQAGTVLIALAVLAGVPGVTSVRISSVVGYSLISWLFGVIGLAFSAPAIERFRNKTQLRQHDEHGRWLMAGFVVCAWSLAGLPPTGGFASRFEIATLAWSTDILPLRVLVCLVVAISALSVYYFGVAIWGVRTNVLADTPQLKPYPAALIVSGFCSAVVIVLFFLTKPFFRYAVHHLWISLAVR